MKKLLVIALIALVAFSAFAQSATEKKDEGPITLEWWTWDTVKINNTVIATDGGAYKTQLSVLAQQKALPDVFMLSSGDIEEWASNGLCRKLDDLVASDPDIYKKFYESMFTSLKDVAKTDYLPGFPFAYVSCDLFYNKDAFDAAGGKKRLHPLVVERGDAAFGFLADIAAGDGKRVCDTRKDRKVERSVGADRGVVIA